MPEQMSRGCRRVSECSSRTPGNASPVRRSMCSTRSTTASRSAGLKVVSRTSRSRRARTSMAESPRGAAPRSRPEFSCERDGGVLSFMWSPVPCRLRPCPRQRAPPPDPPDRAVFSCIGSGPCVSSWWGVRHGETLGRRGEGVDLGIGRAHAEGSTWTRLRAWSRRLAGRPPAGSPRRPGRARWDGRRRAGADGALGGHGGEEPPQGQLAAVQRATEGNGLQQDAAKSDVRPPLDGGPVNGAAVRAQRQPGQLR